MLRVHTLYGTRIVIGWGRTRSPEGHPIMDLDELFLHKFRDLERRCSGDPNAFPDEQPEYRLLMAAPLLREFLFQRKIAGPLLREHNLRLRFRCVPLERMDVLWGLPTPVLDLAADGFAMVDSVNPAFVRDLSIDQFLKAPVGFVAGGAVTVYDLVDYVANAAGGVHYDEHDKEQRPVVRKLHEALAVNGIGAALYAVAGIGRVTVAALQPVVTAVIASSGQGQGGAVAGEPCGETGENRQVGIEPDAGEATDAEREE